MALSTRIGLAFLCLLSALPLSAHAQQLIGDRPTVLKPLRPDTRQELDRREAKKLYGQGLICQRQDRLLEALRCYELARTLDPDAPEIHRALIPLYLALGRTEDAIAACRTTLDLAPGDHETWYLYGRQLKDAGRSQEAAKAFRSAVACNSVSEQLDLLVQIQFELGLLEEELKDYAAAEKSYGEVIKILIDKRETLLDSGPFNPEQIDGEAAKTYERIGQVCTQAGKYDRAVAAFLKAQKKDPEQAGRLSYHLAEVFLAQNKPEDALKHLDLFLRTQPQGATAYELKISILKKLGRESAILPALEQAANRDEHNVPLQVLLAQQYTREKRYAEAEKRFLKLAEDGPAPDIYRGLFNNYKELGATTKVLDMLDQTFREAAKAREDDDDKPDQDPGDKTRGLAAAARGRAILPVLREDAELVKAMLDEAKRDLIAQRSRYRDTWRLLAALAARTKQIDVAENLFLACLPGVTPATEAEVYGGLFNVLLERRKYAEVIKYARTGLDKAQATNRILFYTKMAPAYLHLGKPDEAVTAMDEAVNIADGSNRLGVMRMRVEILREAERYDLALKQCDEMLKEFVRPDEMRNVRYSMSNVYSSMQQHAKSEEQLRLILEAFPDDVTACNDLGYIMADQNKNLEESEKLIRKAIDLDVSEKRKGGPAADAATANAAYIDSLGWVLFRRGQLPQARESLELAAKLSEGEDDPVVWDHLGDVCFKLGDQAQARTSWEKAVGLYDQEKRMKTDNRYKEIKQKLVNLK